MLPLKGYTEKIVMTKQTYDRLSQAEKSEVLAVLNQEKDRLHVLEHILPQDVLAACLFNSLEADFKGFSLNMHPSCDLCLPVESREAGKMSLRFRANAGHLQVSLRDRTGRGFMLGFGEMSSSPLDTPPNGHAEVRI